MKETGAMRAAAMKRAEEEKAKDIKKFNELKEKAKEDY